MASVMTMRKVARVMCMACVRVIVVLSIHGRHPRMVFDHLRLTGRAEEMRCHGQRGRKMWLRHRMMRMCVIWMFRGCSGPMGHKLLLPGCIKVWQVLLGLGQWLSSRSDSFLTCGCAPRADSIIAGCI